MIYTYVSHVVSLATTQTVSDSGLSQPYVKVVITFEKRYLQQILSIESSRIIESSVMNTLKYTRASMCIQVHTYTRIIVRK